MSISTTSNVKCIFMPVSIPVFIPVVISAHSPSGEKKYVQQTFPHQPQQQQDGCTTLTGHGDQSFELVTPLSPNTPSYFGQCRRQGEGEEEPCFVGEEHCVKRSLGAPVTTTYLVVDTQPSVAAECHFFSRRPGCPVQFLSSYHSSSASSYLRLYSLCTEQRFETAFNSTRLSSSSVIGLPNTPVYPLPTPPTPNPRGVPETLPSFFPLFFLLLLP